MDNDSLHGKNVLTHSEAKVRSLHVFDVTYDLELFCERGKSEYECWLTCTFQVTDTMSPIFMDFVGRTITLLKVNGVDLTTKKGIFKLNRLYFAGTLLRPSNTVEVRYINDYDKTGSGFNQFYDEEEKEAYLFTNFEPFDAHRLFPCFDQPDIKARFSLKATLPKGWRLISNSKSTRLTGSSNVLNCFQCCQTPPISTFLFSIVAGPYYYFEDRLIQDEKTIPMRVYCRNSMVKFIEEDISEIFDLTKKGIQFFAEFFDTPFPFVKYDQVFAPGFNHGAMENVSCVVFPETTIKRDRLTLPERVQRAENILTEVAHMWFGNLVTPTWWSSLWLNESFATFMACFAMPKVTEFGELGWQNFNAGIKKWAEKEDQLVTTHPIQLSVADTNSTFLNYDGITFGKAASVIKQLVLVLGEEAFREGMRIYFSTFAWRNTFFI
eukprot:TRINITY_DN8910_c0_g1_i1.p1 TRINITY_DN8910_c0_g1~~TRINITY_DN8910_c0_g1_i1.p1  ORF type:complete len:457 (+),score=83.76 TRINITY_DN8910_c0_g1_i1:61-1371(+)